MTATPEAMQAAPAVGPLPAVLVPPAARFTLSNGLPVVAVHREVAPIVSAALMIRSGAGADRPDQAGLASLTAEMLDEGAGDRDALAFADALEHLGADLWLGSGRDGSQLSVQSPRETFFAALDLAGDVLVRPRLAEGDWQRVLADRHTSAVQRRDQPESVVSVVSDRLLFGEQHPYGRPVEGYARTLENLTLADARAFHATHWRPNHAFLVVAGAFDPAQLRDRLEAALGAWTPGQVPPLPSPPAWPQRPRLCIVDRPGAPQSVVRLTAPGTDRLSPDRPGLAMLNAVLGGSFTSRLNFNLREKHGYTYGAASSFTFLRLPGSFAARASVFAESTAPSVREMLAELAGLHERPVTADEHAKARATLLMRVAEGLSTTGGVAATFGEIGLYGLPLDEPKRFVAALEATTADDLRALAARTIDPDAAMITIVGDRAAIEGPLRELGLPAPVIRNADGDPV
ncbi:MAG TPA: pitrilysin family protein [Polyangia bacterium]|nr:pitrilysin family protein [Polyangia bacterium]